MLGTVKRSIHGSQDCRTCQAILREDGDAHGESHCREALSLELKVEHRGGFANELGALACHILRGIRQDQDELITSITAGDILAAHLPEQEQAELAQDLIPRGMAPGVIGLLKIVHIQHDHPQREFFSRGSQQLTLKGLLHISPVE